MIDEASGNPCAIQILLGHTRIENTVRHLGVDMENALEFSGASSLKMCPASSEAVRRGTSSYSATR